jgi:ribonucleoside-diphosphate reductase alpha chain
MYNPTGFPLKIYKERYGFTETEEYVQGCWRLAKQMVVCEPPQKQEAICQEFFEVLSENLFAPGGRIWYNAGRQHPNMLNCFVLSSDLDSREGWGKVTQEAIVTAMHGGGTGICFDDIRPSGATISTQTGSCPGPMALMRGLDGFSEPIRGGGGRRWASMFGLGLTHPDIEAFINSKKDNKSLTYANISVKSMDTTAFVKAIKADGDWELSWKGRYKKTIKAKALWDNLVSNAYNFAEPGFLNWELVEKESTISYAKKLMITNPCGEIALSEMESCCLGHLVLPRFVKDGVLQYSLLANTIRTAVRFLDNVLTVNYYPLVEMKTVAHKFRRIGLGTTGLADMLIMLGLKYGSEEGNKAIAQLYRFISKVAYEASVMLAVEKGMFPACDPQKHLETGFVSRMTGKIKYLIAHHGIRNCAILTVAPVGTVSILCGNGSSGIEPLFAPAYERRYWKDNKREMELVFHPLFAQYVKEGKSLENFVSARDLTPRQHLEVQAIVQQHIDNAVSKTVNLPEDFSQQEMSDIWLEFLPRLKGTTFYRENTRGFINDKGELELPPLTAIPLEEAKKRFVEGATEGSEAQNCKSGVCEL